MKEGHKFHYCLREDMTDTIRKYCWVSDLLILHKYMFSTLANRYLELRIIYSTNKVQLFMVELEN